LHISGESLLVIILVGVVAGWLAGQVWKGSGFGLVGDLIVGVVGALIASWLFPQLGIHLGRGLVAEIISAAIGAIILLLVLGLFNGSSRRRRWGRW